jgi:predicted ABC-type ATPase
LRKKSRKRPTLYIIAGPNGAGKITFASRFLPRFVRCREFLNADLIAAGLSPFAPETQNVRAGRLLLDRIKELSAAKEDFGFETTLAGVTYVKRLRNMKRVGYRIVLFFLWLASADQAVDRVANRVRQGGHPAPHEDVRRRYTTGLRNLFQLYLPLAETWRMYDASKLPPKVIAYEEGGKLVIPMVDLYRQIKRAAEGGTRE